MVTLEQIGEWIEEGRRLLATTRLTSPGHSALLAVEAPDADAEARLAALFRDLWMPESEILEARLSPQGLAPFLRRPAPAPPERREIVLVFGAAELPAEARAQAFRQLNYQRERLRERGALFVFWLRPELIRPLMEHAGDLYSRLSGFFRFPLPADPIERERALRTMAVALRAARKAPADLPALEQLYREYVETALGWIEFRGLLQVRQLVRFRLEDLFIVPELELTPPSLPPQILPERRRRGRRRPELEGEGAPFFDFLEAAEPVSMALPRALETYPQLVVLGNPGSGKSTLVRWLALVYARGSEGVRAALGWTEDRLPLVLPAAEFALAWQERPALSLEDYLRDRYGPARRLGELRPLIEEALERERIFLLIDGLDEVLSLEARRALIAQLHRLLRRYRGLRILVTSRLAGYGAAPLDAPFVSARLRPLEDPAIRLFLRRWSRALEGALRGQRDLPPAVEEQIERRAQGMSAAILEGHPGIRELARNPLMLTAMALIYEQGTRLPEQRIELYRLLVEAFVETWNRARSLTGRPIDLYLGERRLDEPFAVRILGPLAFEMHRDQPGGWLPREALLDRIARLLQEREDVPADRAGALADDFLRLIQEGTGLLVERGQGLFGFFHRTFEEYLAARYLADRFDPADPLLDLRPFLHHPAWQEVLLLLSAWLGRTSERMATTFIEAVLEAGSPYEDLVKRDLRLAARCLAEGVRVEPRVARRVRKALVDLAFGMEEGAAFPFERLRRAAGDLLARWARTDERVREELLRRAREGRPEARANAIRVLGDSRLSTEAVLQTLLECLRDEDAGVRWAAALALGKLRDPQALPHLLQALEDKNSLVRWAAAEALGALRDPQTLPHLLQALNDEHPPVHIAAAEALGQLRDPQALPHLFQALKDKNRFVRRAAAKALGALGDPQALPHLLQALKDEDPFVRTAIAEALGALRDPQALPHLLQALKDKDEDSSVREAAAKALGGLRDPQALPHLLQALKDEDPSVRMAAAEALGALRDPRALPHLLQALKDKDEDSSVREAAAKALGALRDPQALPHLLQALKDEDSFVRGTAAIALGALRDPQALPHLLQALKDEDSFVRWAAAEVLGALRDPRALPHLLQALKDEDSLARRAAAESLGKLSLPESQREAILEELAAMARSADFPTAEAAFEALWGLLTGETD